MEQEPVEKFLNTQSFLDMGEVLYEDRAQGYIIRAGQIFQGKTVKGGTNLIVTLRVINGWMYYSHGDKVKKVALDTFVKAVEHGDLEPKLAQEVDVGRLSMAAIGLDAIANRRTGEEHLSIVGAEAEERFVRGGK